MVLNEHDRYCVDWMRSRVLLALLRMIEIHEHSINTTRHSDRVATVCRMIGSELKLPYRELAVLWRSCLLHDLGKVGIIADVLGGPKKLSKQQRFIIERHPEWGADILKILDVYKYEAIIIKQHHENYDGTGYPERLHGKNIHLYARILHVVDVYDALTTFREYKKQWKPMEALTHIYENSGTMFDPEIVELFLRVTEMDKFKNIYF